MIRRRLAAVVAVALSGIAGFVPGARAQIVNEEAVGRLTVGAGLGILVPSMSDVDSNFRVVNGILQNHQLRSVKDVNEAVLSYLEVRYRLGRTPPEEIGTEISFKDRISMGFSWGAINAESSFETEQADVLFYARATTYYPHVLYHLPFTEEKLPRLQVMAGGGPLLLRNAYIEWSVHDRTSNTPGFIVDGDLSELAGQSRASADGLGFIVQAASSFQLNKTFSLGLDLGYRFATLSDIQLNDASGEASRFSSSGGDVIVRDPGIWSIVDFWKRSRDAEHKGSRRTDPKRPDEEDEQGGGCAGCRDPYFEGGDIDVDFSGPFAAVALRVHFL
jgi:hypothetical protein